MDDGTLPQLVNAGAVVFGPAMVHTDYVFVAKGITSLSQLNGTTVELSISTAPDYVL